MFLVSCQRAATDLTTLAPVETLVYLETNNLAKTLGALTESEAFKKHSAEIPDFSALENVQLAVVITGFEASEKQVTSEQAILDFRPRFVAIAETHAWSWQAISLVENQLDKFVRQTYGADTRLEKSQKHNGTFFAWSGESDRKSFAFVKDSLIYFGNDESVIEKALAVRRGEAENLSRSDLVTRARFDAGNKLAFGFVSEEGVAQIANFLGVSTAIEASEENAPRSLIAKILPQILKNSVREIVWSARLRDGKIEDVYKFKTKPEVSRVLSETLVSAPENQTNAAEFVPADIFSVTCYNLQNPQIAWRSLLLVSARQVDELSAKILIAFSVALLEPYGVADSEMFLSSVGPEILTVRPDADGEQSAAIVTVKDAEKIKKSLSREINFNREPENSGDARIWKSEEVNLAAAFVGNHLILGDIQSVELSLQARQGGRNFTKNPFYSALLQNKALAVTFSKDMDSLGKIVGVLGSLKDESQNATTPFLTETRYGAGELERRTVSDFGLIGTILKQFRNE